MKRPHHPSEVLPASFCVAGADNDLIFTEDGTRYIDLLGGSGTVLLGHANPTIAAGIAEQVNGLWNTGAVPTRVRLQAEALVETFLPASKRLAGLYSTGMEAAEFALRLARHITGKSGTVGFDGCMHGKSTATAKLSWPNDRVALPGCHRLAYLPELSEEAILENLGRTLAEHAISAVFLEPLQGTRGGHIPSRAFAQGVAGLCKRHDCLLVIDEILTGFHRTGSAFLYLDLEIEPDIVLAGKAMGNGFPVSAVILDRRHPVDAQTLPGSTYAGNPLAAAAVVATLTELRASNVPAKVAKIEELVRARLSGLADLGIAVRGKGALWILDLPVPLRGRDVMTRCLSEHVIVSPTANFVRLLPAATIDLDRLDEACTVIDRACRAELDKTR